jgi:cyclophilin family peptidyl-prolyl cis-trans isomerase/HEAT repeat protein
MRRPVLIACLALVSPSPGAAQVPLRELMLRAEDARPQAEEGLRPLLEGIASPDAALRRQAVRALGRIERPELVTHAAALLGDADARVRSEAYNALGQLARGHAVADVQQRLLQREPKETDSSAWGVLAATLGRLPYTMADQVTRAEQVLASALAATHRKSGPEALTGALEGFEALVRQSRKIATPARQTVEGLRASAAGKGTAGESGTTARARRFAWLALIPLLGEIEAALIQQGLADKDEEVRRLAMVAAGGDTPIEGRQPLVEKGLSDPSPRVRYEALRSWGRQLQKTSCAPVRAALRDESPHVALQAIDLLGAGCPSEDSPSGTLRALAEVLTSRPGAWHSPAHALVSLARVAPADARQLLPRHRAHATWQVRMYAARAAGALGAVDELVKLGRDAHDNVREAALAELVTLKHPEAGRLALEALSRRDYQLVLTAARALGAEGPTPPAAKRDAIGPLLEALERITAEKRDTSRDPRMAILDVLSGLGGRGGAADLQPSVLQPYQRDFDPAVAARAAEILEAWTGSPAKPAPQPLPVPAVSLAAVEALRGAHLRVTMAGRGVFEMRLLADEAPLSALRVATLAREGYYNGLTFHRVVPNFVIQGGSPGANEYMGDGPYMRDEVGLVSHRRGTVGISTRGRDTGDAQLFVNLVDLPRLDHTYTVFAEVVRGMEVVDAILEGDVIEHVELVVPAAR